MSGSRAPRSAWLPLVIFALAVCVAPVRAGPAEVFLDCRPGPLALSSPPLPAAFAGACRASEPASLAAVGQPELTSGAHAERLFAERLPDGTGRALRVEGRTWRFCTPLGESRSPWRLALELCQGALRGAEVAENGSLALTLPARRQAIGVCARAGHRLVLGLAHEEFFGEGELVARVVSPPQKAPVGDARAAWSRAVFEAEHRFGDYALTARYATTETNLHVAAATAVGRAGVALAPPEREWAVRLLRRRGRRAHFASYECATAAADNEPVLLGAVRVGGVDAAARRWRALLGTRYGEARRGGQVVLVVQGARGTLSGGAFSGIVPGLGESYAATARVDVRAVGVHAGLWRPAGRFVVGCGASVTAGVVTGRLRARTLPGFAGPGRVLMERTAENAPFQLYTVSCGARYRSGRLSVSYGVAALVPVLSAELRRFLFGPPAPPPPVRPRVEIPVVHALQVRWTF